MAQTLAGLALLAIGIAGTVRIIPALVDYTYPIVWWGLLLLIDAFNQRRRGRSLWRGDGRRFALVTLPASVLLWLLFEALNFPAPQWIYRGDIDGMLAKVLFGFAAFSTVIPIVVECYWLVGGHECLPGRIAALVRDWRYALVAAGLAVAAMPVVNDVFWFNQGMWLAPALVLLPLMPAERCPQNTRLLISLVTASLLAGVLWEAINWPSRTHWEYLILPDAPHLFRMPLLGYIGFIPFGASTLIVYASLRRIPPRLGVAITLYGAAFALLWLLTELYIENSLWLPPE